MGRSSGGAFTGERSETETRFSLLYDGRDDDECLQSVDVTRTSEQAKAFLRAVSTD